MLDHSGIVQNFVTGSVARLQIGRAYAMMGDTAKARASYQDFLNLWKDADPDIPILIEAKAEYAKLHSQLSKTGWFGQLQRHGNTQAPAEFAVMTPAVITVSPDFVMQRDEIW